jgi:DNA invertase Pin-like site-specific DNA recombinase
VPAAGLAGGWTSGDASVGVMLGYVCLSSPADDGGRAALHHQARIMTEACRSLGLRLEGLVCERVPRNGRVPDRPALDYALERIECGEAAGLVVSDLSMLSRSAADLGAVLTWFTRNGARLVAIAEALDNATVEGRVAVRALTAVANTERERLAQRTRNGLQAAREGARLGGRPAVADDHDLHVRIIEMRARGMTMQAIADRLNQEGVPTVRGGTLWRPSSVLAALGYQRRRHRKWLSTETTAGTRASGEDAREAG